MARLPRRAGYMYFEVSDEELAKLAEAFETKTGHPIEITPELAGDFRMALGYAHGAAHAVMPEFGEALSDYYEENFRRHADATTGEERQEYLEAANRARLARHAPKDDPQVSDLLREVKPIIAALRKLEGITSAVQSGPIEGNDLELFLLLQPALKAIVAPDFEGIPGMDGDPVHMHLSDLRGLLPPVIDALEHVAEELSATRGKAGRATYDWYDIFLAPVLRIAEHNGIRLSVSTDPVTNERKGAILDLVEAFEGFLVSPIRSDNRNTLHSRFKRSLKRLNTAKAQNPPEKSGN
ncbi:hypothetical protein GR183_03060 [Stappia sp. GBMRC 2046]|uniref:Uncharacterized protein n=1 Tax=Stappia sediminis TaxID=2692190 RepID=A0A7X3S6D6_9HYPH|nr:hypothetical protein [Stappia sediminis]MXN63872.1 hypothetical protein [Stappia sediminis]